MSYDENVPFTKSEDPYSNQNDAGADKIFLDQADQELRAGFVRKVFSILSLQLFVTFGSVLLFSYNESANSFLLCPERSGTLLSLATITLIGSTFAIICCNHLTRRHPHNMILLALYTFSQSVLLSTVAVRFDPDTITLAVGGTFGVTLFLGIFAQKTSIDFTTSGIYLNIALWVMILFGFISVLISLPFLNTLYAYFGTLIFCCYIVYDVQLILGGGHKLQFSIDDYVMAALMLYIDIIQLFLFILRLIGSDNN